MKHRKGFTLIELLVVIGIILILAGLLLPMVNRARRQSNMNTERLDLQTLASAIEAYRLDFNGSIPSNVSLPSWNGLAGNPPPPFLSLATALIGPGPLYTTTVNGVNQAGDGANGFGFRSTYAIAPTSLASSASAGGNTLTINGFTSSAPFLTAPIYPPGNGTMPNAPPLPALATGSYPLFISINDPIGGNEGALGVLSISNAGVVALASPLQYSHAMGVPVAFRSPTGNLWGPYISTDRFKYIWVNYWTGSNPNFPAQPLLLDRWGGPIQYFTRFGPNNNRTGNTSNFTAPTPAPTSITAGPLYGYSTPNGTGINSIWDQQDGTLNNNLAAGGTVDETLAFKWMLGDDNGDNLIDNNETLHYTGDYVLISAGPDTDNTSLDTIPSGSPTYNQWTYKTLPPSRFCNLNGVSPDLWDQTFRASGNVYNFSR